MGQFALAWAAISTADVSQCQPTPLVALLTERNGFAVIARKAILSRPGKWRPRPYRAACT
jgi:hypothetical protein